MTDFNPANAYVPADPAVTIVKSINGDDANTAPGVEVAAGSTMNVTFLVTNTGNVTLDPVTVTDDKIAATDITCPKTALAAGEQMTCTATTPAPAAGTVHTDTGTVVGTPPTNPNGPALPDVIDSDQANAHVADAPGVAIVKSINGDDANTAPGVEVAAGSTMNVTFLVTNTGNVTLDPVTVTDDKIAATDITCPKTALAAGEQMTCTATAPAPAPGTIHTDTGTVVGTPPAAPDGTTPPDVTSVDQANANAPGHPAVTIVKSINGDDANTAPGVEVAAGSTMNVTFLVTNTGDVTLDPVTVTDDKIAATDISCPKTALAAGEQMTCTATTPAPAAGTVHTDTGTVVGTPPTNPDGTTPLDVTSTDLANANTPAVPPTIVFSKTLVGPATAADGVYTIQYDITAKNTGTVDGSYSVADYPKFGAGITIQSAHVTATEPAGPVPVNALWDGLTDNLVVYQQTIAAGAVQAYRVTITATVGPGSSASSIDCTTSADETGTGFLNLAVFNLNGTISFDSACDSPAPGKASVTIVKSINGDDANTAPGVEVAAGSTMNVTFLVTNTGNVTLDPVTVTDDKIAATDITCPKTALAAGEQMTCTAAAPAPAAGTVHTDTGTVVGTPPTNPDGTTPADVTSADQANANTPADTSTTSTTVPDTTTTTAPETTTTAPTTSTTAGPTTTAPTTTTAPPASTTVPTSTTDVPSTTTSTSTTTTPATTSTTEVPPVSVPTSSTSSTTVPVTTASVPPTTATPPTINRSPLPKTGESLIPLGLLGAGLIVAGFLLRRRRRAA